MTQKDLPPLTAEAFDRMILDGSIECPGVKSGREYQVIIMTDKVHGDTTRDDSVWRIGENHDKDGRPLFEVTGPVSASLEYLELLIADYRRRHPATRPDTDP